MHKKNVLLLAVITLITCTSCFLRAGESRSNKPVSPQKTTVERTVYLVRHAKAVPDKSMPRDYDRTLTDEGKAEAEKMAKYLQELEVSPQYVLTSPAPRALETASIFANTLQFPVEKIRKDTTLYACSPEVLLKAIRQLDNQYFTVVIVAHNPAVTAVANLLQTSQAIAEVPTGGVVSIVFEATEWTYAEPGNARLRFFKSPADIDN